MKAVILAAGRGTRLAPFTQVRPKPLVKVRGKPLILHVLDALPDEITECVIVLGYLGYQIRRHLGDRYRRFTLTYVEQQQPGTGGALLAAAPFLLSESRFFVIGADDIFQKVELAQLLRYRISYGIHYGLPNKATTGKAVFDEDMLLTGFAAAEHADEPRYFGVGAYVLPHAIFEETFHVLPSGELSIPHTLATAAFGVEVVLIDHWIPVNTLEEHANAELALLNV